VTASTNADLAILNILGHGHKFDGRSPLSGIVCSAALMKLLSFASAWVGDHRQDLALYRRSTLSSTRVSGMSTLIGSRFD
jgi:hypothetical protein